MSLGVLFLYRGSAPASGRCACIEALYLHPGVLRLHQGASPVSGGCTYIGVLCLSGGLHLCWGSAWRSLCLGWGSATMRVCVWGSPCRRAASATPTLLQTELSSEGQGPRPPTPPGRVGPPRRRHVSEHSCCVQVF